MEQNIDFESERKQLTRKAWVVTIAYGIVLVVLACLALLGEAGVDAFLDMKPNEVGDLLAGIAGPVAFIWLVYGYFLQGIAIRQQAQELSQNTRALQLQEEALRAQVSELNASVEQQRQLVEISRKQMEADQEALREGRDKQRKAALPRFLFSSAGMMSGAGYAGTVYTSSLENIGNTVADVKISCSPDIGSISPRYFASFESRARHQVQWQSSGKDTASNSWILIEYVDTLGVHGKQEFQPVAGENGQFNGAIVKSD